MQISRHRIIRLVKSFLLFVFLCFNVNSLIAQNYITHNYTVYDGLPSSSIRCTFKDSQGLLWIGTDAALCTYDGKTFSIVKTQEEKTVNQIWSITEDKQGNLWFGSFGEGVYTYDGEHFKHYTNKSGLTDNYVRKIYYSKTFDLIATANNRGANIIKEDTIIASPEWMNTKEKSYCFTGVADAKDFIYFTTLGSVNPVRYFPNENRFISINDSGKFYPNGSLSIFVSIKGDTLFGIYPNGVLIKSQDGKRVTDNTIGQVFNIDEDRAGNIWVPAWSYINRDLNEGVYKYDGKSFVNLQATFGITDKGIWSVLCDKEQDIIWIGTSNDGLYKATPTVLTSLKAEDFDLSHLSINDLTIDSKDRLWITDKSELICMNTDGSHSLMDRHKMMVAFQHYWKTSNRFVDAQIDSVQKALRTLSIGQFSRFKRETKFDFQWVVENEDQSIFFSNRFGIYNYNPENKTIDYFGCEGSEGFFDFIGSDTLVWSGWGYAFINPCFRDRTANITNSTERKSPLFKSNILFPFNADGEPKDVSRMVKNSNQIWYTSWVSGLWRSDDLNLTHFNASDSTIENNLNDICFDERDHVISGSNSGEVSIATYTNNKLVIDYRLRDVDGLLGNKINWLVTDKSGFLWVGTNLGLNCVDLNKLYDLNEYHIRHFDKEEGYNGQSSKKAVIDSQNNLFIASNNKLIKLNTNQLLGNKTEPIGIILKSLSINQQPVTNNIINGINQKSLQLKYTQNNFLFHFDILNYINPKKDLFRYRLVGFDKEWSEWAKSRQANYTNLSSGKYVFRVESLNQNTHNKAEPLVIEFFIPYPFWELWYFQLIVVLLAGAIIVIVTKKLVDRKRFKQLRETEIERKLLELEMQALQAQMNPHFIFNCISGIQYCILDNKLDEVMDYLSDFSKVVRISLENASHNFIPLEKEIDFLYSYLRLEQMRFQDKFDFEILHQNVTNKGLVFIPPMMVQPFAENAIKHGFSTIKRKGILSIEFETIDGNILRCTITDNGNGRSDAPVNKPKKTQDDRIHSSSITDMRIQLFNQPENFKIKYTDLFENDVLCGLKVELFLPFK